MKKILTLVVILGLFTNIAYGSGFQLNEHGARAMAMAGAFTGLANDPSAIYFNPAGIIQLKGTQFLVGATMIMPLSSYTTPLPNNKTTDMNGQIFSPINFYVTHQIGDKLAVGLGVNNQYGLGTKWDPSWAGRYLAGETAVTTFFITPVIAYRLFDNLTISVGGSYVLGDVKIVRSSPLRDPVTGAAKPDASIAMEGNKSSFGFNAGILFKASSVLQFGLSYRSEVTIDFSGTLTTTPATLNFTHPLAGPQSIKLPAGNITAPLTTPQNLTFGIAYMPSTQWTTTFDFQFVGWSSYKKLEVTATDFYFDPPTNKVTVTSADRNYKDTYIARLGFEYKASDNFALRFGMLYDHNPVKDEYVEPTLPDADRLGFNVGFGGKLTEKLGFDFAYMFLSFAERKVANSIPAIGFNGTYANSAHLFGFNLSYSL